MGGSLKMYFYLATNITLGFHNTAEPLFYLFFFSPIPLFITIYRCLYHVG